MSRLLGAFVSVVVAACGSGKGQPAKYGPVSAAHSTVSADKLRAVANGNDEVVVTAVIRDAEQRPVPGATVTFRLSGVGRVSEPSPTSGQGEAIVHVGSTKAGPKTLSVSLDVDGAEQPLQDVTFTFVAGPSEAGVFLTHPTTTRAGERITPAVTIQVTDRDGNPTVEPFSMSVRLVRSNAGTVQHGEARASVDGVITFPDLVINRAQNGYALRAEAANGSADESRTFDVLVGEVSATASTLVATPTVATANGSSSVSLTFTAKDLGGNPLSAQPVVFSLTNGDGSFTDPSGSTNALGEYSTTLTSTQAGMKLVRATVGSLTFDVAVSFVP